MLSDPDRARGTKCLARADRTNSVAVWCHNLQSEQTGWVLYLEGSTDLEILRGFAERLGHPAGEVLQRPFVKYVQQPQKARDHFYGLQEAKPDLRGMLLLDRQDRELLTGDILREYAWKQLAVYVPNELIDPEVSHVLDLILETSRQAQPRLG